jgi:hypothetical protein
MITKNNSLAEVIIYNLPKSCFTNKLKDAICKDCYDNFLKENDIDCNIPCELVQYIDMYIKKK